MAKVRRPFDIVTPAQVAAVASVGEVDEITRTDLRREVQLARVAPIEQSQM